MKKLALLIGLGIMSYTTQAQTHTVKQDVKNTANDVAHGTKEGAKAVGNKTAEIASKGAATVTDKIYEGKVGPDGQTIYINKHSQYYWVGKRGQKVYVKKSQLRDK